MSTESRAQVLLIPRKCSALTTKYKAGSGLFIKVTATFKYWNQNYTPRINVTYHGT